MFLHVTSCFLFNILGKYGVCCDGSGFAPRGIPTYSYHQCETKFLVMNLIKKSHDLIIDNQYCIMARIIRININLINYN